MIRKIRNFINEKKKLKTCFLENGNFMSPGNYVFDDSIKYITRNDRITQKRTSEILKHDYYRKATTRFFIYLLKKTIFRKSIFIPESELAIKDFTGTVYLPIRSTNGYSDKKIFDFAHKKVLSVFSEEKDYQSVINNYHYFNQHFPMPEILGTNAGELLILEELIICQPPETWRDEDCFNIMKDIFCRYKEYFCDCKQKRKYYFTIPKEVFNSTLNNEEIDFIRREMNQEILLMSFPNLMVHGDLWTGNLLLKKEEKVFIYYIDWEYSNELIFFYDFFNLMWIEIYMNNNYKYFNRYLNGGFDQELIEIFSIFELSFRPEWRLDYFHLYFLNFLQVRGIHFNWVDRQTYLNRYKNLLVEFGI